MRVFLCKRKRQAARRAAFPSTELERGFLPTPSAPPPSQVALRMQGSATLAVADPGRNAYN